MYKAFEVSRITELVQFGSAPSKTYSSCSFHFENSLDRTNLVADFFSVDSYFSKVLLVEADHATDTGSGKWSE